MNIEEVMDQLRELGSEQTKNIYRSHGAKEPLFGVKVGDLKKLAKHVKKDQHLALALYSTGNHDAMYLAGLSVNPKLMEKDILQEWVKGAYWYMLAEYTVAGVTAESKYAIELAEDWMQSEHEMIAVCGWSTYAHYISITPNEQVNIADIRKYLQDAQNQLHQERNRVRYAMNQFVICVGSFVESLHEEAITVASQIGKVHVDIGTTACKVPLAKTYIEKVRDKGNIGKKKKTSIC
ncbi:3-methyladenine DNA glycosylase AlkD [Bacillus mesophilus]|uniref:DNA alkylation repair protein n=1 Tax=Bacillus mesophilus TaxID=1808955 RepID=UPI00195716B3|nr:DNA alkylation repair protein [Bacillus mesophilus]MBM7662090.1 3-methyladenine DNA glycosylase AlkD [Bacillus mesophilus]